jgi:hypothetical protein
MSEVTRRILVCRLAVIFKAFLQQNAVVIHLIQHFYSIYTAKCCKLLLIAHIFAYQIEDIGFTKRNNMPFYISFRFHKTE